MEGEAEGALWARSAAGSAARPSARAMMVVQRNSFLIVIVVLVGVTLPAVLLSSRGALHGLLSRLRILLLALQFAVGIGIWLWRRNFAARGSGVGRFRQAVLAGVVCQRFQA